MADSAWDPSIATAIPDSTPIPRHAGLVRATHWIVALCFFALLLSGIEILISHPRFYWGETGNSNMPAFFQIPIPASRGHVKTGYNYVLPDQNGWSRSLHFQSAWFLVLSGLLYFAYGIFSGHFRKNLLPDNTGSFSQVLKDHLRFKPSAEDDTSYNVLQRIAYSSVVFVFFPFMIWTGLAMSPAIASVFPLIVTILGGQQSARTLHFFDSVLLVGFVLVHILMVALAGFGPRMRAMITGRAPAPKETA
jgi:thiosulfate reductase cytochrome b subunit